MDIKSISLIYAPHGIHPRVSLRIHVSSYRLLDSGAIERIKLCGIRKTRFASSKSKKNRKNRVNTEINNSILPLMSLLPPSATPRYFIH